jgi:glutaredoxin
MHIQILGKPDCHLCHVAEKIAKSLQNEFDFTLEWVDIQQSTSLSDQYAMRIPVMLIDGSEAGSGRLTEGLMRRAIKKARWSGSISRILSRIKNLMRG